MEKVLDLNTINTVLYHGDCTDGFGSAFCVWLYYKQKFGLESANQIEYIGCWHSNDPLEEEFLGKLKGKNILMCDFSYKYDQLMRVLNVANTFIILDHHKTAQADLEKIPPELKVFDMNRSGTGITWDYFFPGNPLPKFLAHIQDRDLWTYKIPGTAELTTYLFQQKFSFEFFEELMEPNRLEEAIQKGSNWLEYKQMTVSNVAKRAKSILQKINNKLQIVLYVGSVMDSSDVGNKVFEYFPLGDFSAIFSHNLRDMSTRFSLRSTDERSDVSVIAKQWNGGGHRNASGLSIPEIVVLLPTEGKFDNHIISVMRDRQLGPMVDMDSNSGEIEYEYSLLPVSRINCDWLTPDYLDLLKRKFPDSRYIVFQSPSEKVSYDESTNFIIPYYDYTMIFNEQNLKNTETKLGFISLNAGNTYLSFTSEKKFEDIYQSLLQTHADTIIEEDPAIGEDPETSSDETSGEGYELI
jgi:oligoribonuclease NrnB/cAMP/cGMP phosphodiesterase (DHH superfamily)